MKEKDLNKKLQEKVVDPAIASRDCFPVHIVVTPEGPVNLKYSI